MCHLPQLILRQREDHGDRLQLRDDDEAAGIGGVYDVALVDEPDARASGQWRADRGVVELDLRRVDIGLVGRDRGLQLPHQRALRVDLLLRIGERAALLEAPQVELRVLQVRLVFRFGRARQIERRLERPRIDLRQHIAGVYVLAFLEVYAVELAVDARVDRDGVESLHGAEGAEKDRYIFLCRRSDRCGNRLLLRLL